MEDPSLQGQTNAIYSLNSCLRSDISSWEAAAPSSPSSLAAPSLSPPVPPRGELFIQKKEKDCATSLYQLQPRAEYALVDSVLLLPYLLEKYMLSPT